MENKKKILIVDDDIKYSTELSEKVKAAGMDVFVARSGKEALDHISENPVDFIILDFIMPEMDGYTFYHILTHDMRRQIPAIILTNLKGTQDKNEELEVFIKPDTDLDILIGKIKNHLETHPAS